MRSPELGGHAPRMLGATYNKYHPESKHDPVLLEAYTQTHYDEDAGHKVDALVQLPQIGLIRFDDERMKDAMHNRVSMHLMDPMSPIGSDMFTLCTAFEQAVVGAGVGVRR